MIITLLILTFAFIHLLLLAITFTWTGSSTRVASNNLRCWFLRALLLGMFYDNLTVALGYWFIDNTWFKWANYPRFYIHVLILPFLTLFTYSLLKNLNLAANIDFNLAAEQASFWQRRPFYLFCMLFTFATLSFGIYHELLNLQLAPNEALGFIRYSKAASSPPFATIVTNLFTIGLSIVLWRKTAWKILTLGSCIIFIVNAASAGRPWGFLAGNFAELIFVTSLLLSHKHFAAFSTFSSLSSSASQNNQKEIDKKRNK